MKPQRRKLNQGQLWKIEEGQILRVLCGEVWITWLNGDADFVLQEGHALDLHDKRAILIEPLRKVGSNGSALLELSA